MDDQSKGFLAMKCRSEGMVIASGPAAGAIFGHFFTNEFELPSTLLFIFVSFVIMALTFYMASFFGFFSRNE